MAQAGQRKCWCCRQFFVPDRRNRRRQHYCSATACRRASKTASQTAWLSQPQNQDYFRDATHVERVRQWRAAHPGYGRGRRRIPVALQDRLIAQVIEPAAESGVRTDVALQDPWMAPQPMLAGLIAHLFDVAQQDDMAATARRLVQRGQDLIHGKPGEDHQTRAVSTTAAPGAGAVQLG